MFLLINTFLSLHIRYPESLLLSITFPFASSNIKYVSQFLEYLFVENTYVPAVETVYLKYPSYLFDTFADEVIFDSA